VIHRYSSIFIEEGERKGIEGGEGGGIKDKEVWGVTGINQ
jgi:hypothetical protein